VSFDVASLFTKVSLEDTLRLVSQQFDTHFIALSRQVLTTTYLLYSGCLYDQRDGVTMRSPLTPVIDNLHTESFKQQAVSLAKKKQAHCY
jgi:hypothetical protein